MREEEEIRAMLKHLLHDKRLKGKPDNVSVNTLFARIELEAKIAALKWVLRWEHGN